MLHRNTVQKAFVIEAVNKLKCHATADEIYAYIHLEHPNVSKATVYRNLHELAQNGEIKLLEIPGEPSRFDHLSFRHNHLKCVMCSKIFDVKINLDQKLMEDLQNKLKDSGGFDITDHNIIFQGICPNCKNKKKN